MNKKYIGLGLAAMFFLVVSVAAAREKSGNPFDAIWNAITALQEQVANIQAGPQRPSAPGSVAFLDGGGGDGAIPYILTSDGIVYGIDRITSQRYLVSQSYPNIDPPIPVSRIYQRALYTVVDFDGNVWRYDISNHTWNNIGYP